MKLQFGTKAETLMTLEKKLRNAKVLPQISFTLEHWKQEPDEIWKRVQKMWTQKLLVVRSSAMNEDTKEESKAGKYKSVLDVRGKSDFFNAVEAVLTSYVEENKKNQVLVQPMLENVMLCGVAFTIEPNTAGNYYVINYDDSTESTSSITSGSLERDKLFYCFKENFRSCFDSKMIKICAVLKELEELFGQDNLDVEFAMNYQQELYIFQVRQLCIGEKRISVFEQTKALESIKNKINHENHQKPFLQGKRTIYGIMPDWNPAEIIGIRPKPLALSLYKEIITDNIWAYQRDNYGYKNLRSFPLLIDFCGLPYIDTRVSFNSFIPSSLSKELSDKLVNYYLDCLEKNPNLHDKIEFEIAFTCYTLDIQERIECLKEHDFSQEEIDEIIDALREMTKKIIDNEEGLWKKDYQKIEYLVTRHEMIMKEHTSLDKIAKIYWLLEDCKRYGTLPFAGLARAGFIAVQLLKSLVSKKILSEAEYQLFMSDLKTVSSIMRQDKAELSKPSFLYKYGHLRPGTYDICSKRYDEMPDVYFDWEDSDYEFADKSCETFKLSLNQISILKKTLCDHGLSDDVLGFFHFVKTAIEGREFAKFIFTRSLSDAMKLFEELGEEFRYSVNDCAFADISIIKNLYASSLETEVLMKQSIWNGMEKYKLTESIMLPPLLIDEMDVYSFYYPDTEPNFITLKEITAEVCLVEDETQNQNISEKIVMIPSADPGYDWIFSHYIRGFITKFGGANSHMAIRANELSIPAVIGAGEKMFENLKKSKVLQIDAALKKVSVLK